MLINKYISILRNKQPAIEPDYCLSFDSKGYIVIDSLNTFLDLRNDFSFEMEFKISQFAKSGLSFLMNSCVAASNKIGIAVDGNFLYVQFLDGPVTGTERYIPFSSTGSWHTISLLNSKGIFSASLDSSPIKLDQVPSFSLPSALGFKIASDTALSSGLSGFVDNILLTDLKNPIAQYPLNTGSGSIVYDSINKYNGNITNGTWQSHIQ